MENISIRKMRVENPEAVNYFINAESGELNVNSLLEKTLKFSFKGEINCINCSRSVKKTFNSGYCFPCFQTLAECDMCIMKPELCHFAKGTCRDEAFGQKHCMIQHIVYLADSSSLKVGITRNTNVPYRWIDQGATKALPIWTVDTRKDSGDVEHFLKEYIADKTNWRNMLKGLTSEESIEDKAEELWEICENASLPGEALYDKEAVLINYPVIKYPEKVKTHNFDKNPEVEGKLLGIKGQYLIFDTGVLNMRKFAGYKVELSY